MNVVLASASPRRKELLQLIVPQFIVEPARGEERMDPHVSPEQTVQLLAQQKALEVLQRYPEAIVIGADTLVVLDDEVLGKPANSAQAQWMLKQLANRTHVVHTGVCIAHRHGVESFVSSAQVTFAPMTQLEIETYVDTEEPLDKAGAYGIQGQGARFVKGIQGDYYTVMGLPVCALYNRLKDMLQ